MPSAYDEEDLTFDRPLNDRELGILVLDGSGSMGAEQESPGVTKAEAVRRALADPQQGFFSLFKNSGRVNAVDFTVLVFDQHVETRIPTTPAADLDVEDAFARLDLMSGHGGRTDMRTALEEAGDLALSFVDPQARPPMFATILLMTDGAHNEPAPDPSVVIAAADEIRRKAPQTDSRPSIVIACAPYGPDADTATLQQIATPGYYQKCNSATEIRAFFIRSLAARGQ